MTTYKTDELTGDLLNRTVAKALGYNEKSYYQITGGMIHGGLFFFESEQESDEFFNIFCNEVIEKTGLYAAIYCPERGCLSENC